MYKNIILNSALQFKNIIFNYKLYSYKYNLRMFIIYQRFKMIKFKHNFSIFISNVFLFNQFGNVLLSSLTFLTNRYFINNCSIMSFE